MRPTEVASAVEGLEEFIVGRDYYKERKGKLTCLEILKHSHVLQFNNFIEKNPFTPKTTI